MTGIDHKICRTHRDDPFMPRHQAVHTAIKQEPIGQYVFLCTRARRNTYKNIADQAQSTGRDLAEQYECHVRFTLQKKHEEQVGGKNHQMHRTLQQVGAATDEGDDCHQQTGVKQGHVERADAQYQRMAQ
ncbi:MAG: hypothetical protein RLZZ09_785 [Pseudomonadota bacterium]